MRLTPHYTGKVVWFSKMLGYGFLERCDGTDVLCYFNAVKNPGPEILRENEFVEYDVIDGENGPHAANVVRFASLALKDVPSLPTILPSSGYSAQASIDLWHRAASRAKRLVAKVAIPIAKVAYMNGVSTDNLSAREIALAEEAQKFVVSLDLSASEDRRSAAYSCFRDAGALRRNLDRLNFIQISRSYSLDSQIVWRLAKAPVRMIEIAMRFKDGFVHTFPARLQQDRSFFWFYALDGLEQRPIAWWNKPRR